jgi:hypothetical protein
MAPSTLVNPVREKFSALPKIACAAFFIRPGDGLEAAV